MIKFNEKKLISTIGVIIVLTLITSTFYYSLKEEKKKIKEKFLWTLSDEK